MCVHIYGTPATELHLLQQPMIVLPSGTIAIANTGVGSGISYDWETSDNGSSGWTSVGGVYQSSFAQSPASTTYYRHVTTCSSSGQTAYSNVVTRTVATVTSVSMKPSVGIFGDLSAPVPNSGNVQWYGASTGGSVISTGDNFLTW